MSKCSSFLCKRKQNIKLLFICGIEEEEEGKDNSPGACMLVSSSTYTLQRLIHILSTVIIASLRLILRSTQHQASRKENRKS